MYRGETTESLNSETLMPRIHRATCCTSQSGLTGNAGRERWLSDGLQRRSEVRGGNRQDFAQFDENIVETIDIRKNGRII